MKAGLAETPIKLTSEVGLGGYGPDFRRLPARSVGGGLRVAALALSDGRTVAALVSCDLVGLDWAVVAATRRRVEETAGIPGSNILISATHSHSAPAAQFLRRWAEEDPVFSHRLPGILAATVEAALNRLAPCRLSLVEASCPGHSFNRVWSDGPTDPRVRGLRVDFPSSEPAVLLHHACHPVYGSPEGLQASADFPGLALAAIRERGFSGGAIFLQGACGDINPIHCGKGRTFAWRHGLALAEGVAEATEATPVDGSIHCLSAEVELALDKEDALAEASDFLYGRRLRDNHLFLAESRFLHEWAVETLALVEAPEEVRCEIQALAVGDFLILGVSGELSVRPALEIEAGTRFGETWIVGYANGNVGYLNEERDREVEGYGSTIAPKIYGSLPFREGATRNVVLESVLLGQRIWAQSRMDC